MSGVLVDEHSFLLENAELARVLNGIPSPPRCADHGRPAMASPFRCFPVDFMPENIPAMSSIHPAAMALGRHPFSLSTSHTALEGEEMYCRRMQEVGFADEEDMLCRRMQEVGFFAEEERARERRGNAACERERGEGYADDVQAAMMTMMATMMEEQQAATAARDRPSLQRFLPSNNEEEWLAESMDYCTSDEFRMYEFKVRRCMRGRSHDWTECPFAHPGEKARRRDPRRFHYAGTACPDFRKGACRRGDACEFSHGVFECWLHPARYRTQLCKDAKLCKRRVCFFAHSPSQLRLVSAHSTSLSSPSPNPNHLLLKRGAVPLSHGGIPASLSYADGTSPSIDLDHELSWPRRPATAVEAYEDCAPLASFINLTSTRREASNFYQDSPPTCREAMEAEGRYQVKQPCSGSSTMQNSMYPMEGKPAAASSHGGSPFKNSMLEPHSKNGATRFNHVPATLSFNGPLSRSRNELSLIQATGASMDCLPRFSDVISDEFGSTSIIDGHPSFCDAVADQVGPKNTRPAHLSLLSKLSGGYSQTHQLPSPTSTLIGHSPSPPPLSPPLSPCESPPMSPSLSSNLARRTLTVSSQTPSPDAISQVHSSSIAPAAVGVSNSMACALGPSPLSWNGVANRRGTNPVGPSASGHMEPVLDQSLRKAFKEGQGTNHLAAIVQQMELRRLATKMHKMKSDYLSGSIPGSPNTGWAEAWDPSGGMDPPASQRVESGRELRARIYGKLGRELLQENESPDLGWVNELVK